MVEVDRGTPLRDIASLSRPVEPAQALLVGGYGGAWVGPEHFATPYASLSLRTIGASAGVGVIVVLGADACGVAESARIARYLAGQSAGQCGPCVFGLPAIADDLAALARGQRGRRSDAATAPALGRGQRARGVPAPRWRGQPRAERVSVFAADVVAHEQGAPCAHALDPTVLRFPGPIAI